MKRLPARRPIGWKPPESCQERLYQGYAEIASKGYKYSEIELFISPKFGSQLQNEFCMQARFPTPFWEFQFLGIRGEVRQMNVDFVWMAKNVKPRPLPSRRNAPNTNTGN